jgi:catechol 2,3-dioxygenase-like lactoylglutathione lyase family enzyme
MSAPIDTEDRSDHRQCGCCGRNLPANRVTELGTTPGVFICAGCALWAARRAGPLSALARLPIIRSLRRGHRRHPPGGTEARLAIPVLPATDLDRTAAFYAPAGFVETERYPGYLLLHNAGVELHFSQPGSSAPGECFIHVGDARALWKQLRDRHVDGVGPIADQDYGLREFVLTDPDGNRIRFGSPVG